MNIILHITHQNEWEQAKVIGLYRADSLATEGFIHCSLPEQIVHVANTFFLNQPGLVLLVINAQQVRSPIQYEAADGDEFPHLYGPLNLGAVIQALPFEPGIEGQFNLPEALTDLLTQASRS